jgi:hypothetical protein
MQQESESGEQTGREQRAKRREESRAIIIMKDLHVCL